MTERIMHNLVQGSDAWALFRLSHFGASEASAMLGLSSKVKRSELLHMKHTGTAREFSDWVQENILDYGHEVEALARPIVEAMIDDDLYPVTCSLGLLSASCDGLTMSEDTAFEHKQWNESLATAVRAGVLPDEHMPQCQQVMLVTGARRVVFVVSNGTAEKMETIEVESDPAWHERLRAGWAQFEKDLAAYTLPEAQPVIVADAVQALPAVSVQISGHIDVRDNFKVFETALRDFLENKLIREPQNDQDFADLDVQIKAMKKAEETLDAAEAMMLAQIQSVDGAKRHKDMLAKLVRDNRLMAEKLFESEKARRRAERVDAARKAFAAHTAELQREIVGVRLDVTPPDFPSVIKGLKTLASVQDKLDTALANGKISADAVAKDLRTKLTWFAKHDAHHFLFRDLQNLIQKPAEDFELAVNTRIAEHKTAEEKRLEADRERIRAEEKARAEAAVKAEVVAPAPAADVQVALPLMQPVAVRRVALPAPASAPASTTPSLRLGQINERLAPITLTADGLAALGFPCAATDKNAKLYHEESFSKICAALVQHLEAVAQEHEHVVA